MPAVRSSCRSGDHVPHHVPQVVRRMLPESLNLFISMFKATTIVSLIGCPT